MDLGVTSTCSSSRTKWFHSDVLLVDGLDRQFDIVTMVGSTRMESGLYGRILEKAFSFLKDGGSLYYQTLDEAETKEDMAALCGKSGINIDRYLLDAAYGFQAQYFKLTKANPRRAH